jgi:aquaporin Z
VNPDATEWSGVRWDHYLIEAAGAAILLFTAGVGTVVLQHHLSPVRQAIGMPIERRLLMGLLMGSTLAILVYSRFGARSGAHFNPVVTFSFYRLGKVQGRHALAYVVAQFAGAFAGVAAVSALLRPALADADIRWYATTPGAFGPGIAFAAELTISFVLFSTVLYVSNNARFSKFTGLAAAALVVCFITFEAPLSGMSMNPARSAATAAAGSIYEGLWIYFAAPLAGMLLAAEAYVRARGRRAVYCAKLNHTSSHSFPCAFHCNYIQLGNEAYEKNPGTVLTS